MSELMDVLLVDSVQIKGWFSVLMKMFFVTFSSRKTRRPFFFFLCGLWRQLATVASCFHHKHQKRHTGAKKISNYFISLVQLQCKSEPLGSWFFRPFIFITSCPILYTSIILIGQQVVNSVHPKLKYQRQAKNQNPTYKNRVKVQVRHECKCQRAMTPMWQKRK